MAQINTDRLISIGRNALYFEDYVLSIQYFNQVIKVKPHLIDPYFYRAVAKIELEDFTGAQEDLDVVISRNPFIPMAYYARAYCSKRLNQWSNADADLEKALEYSPENTLYLINRIEVWEHLSIYDKAMDGLLFLQRRGDNSTALASEIGRLQLEMGDTLSAIAAFEQITNTDSLNPDAWSAKGLVMLIAGRDSDALSAYDRAVQLRSRSAATFVNRGILNYRRHNYRQALSDYDRAIVLDSLSLSSRFNRALLRSEVGDLNRAIDDLDFIISHDSIFFEAIYQRAILNHQLGDLPAAIADYSAIIRRYPYFTPAIYARSNAYSSLGRSRDAFDDQERIRSIRELQRRGGIVSDDSYTDSIDTSVKIAREESESVVRRQSSLFAQRSTTANRGFSSLRGAIQNMDVDLQNEPNIQLSFYRRQTEGVFSREYMTPDLSSFNDRHLFAPLYLVTDEVTLTEGMILYHFSSIDQLSQKIDISSEDASLFLARAFDYALVKDFPASVDDFSRSIFLDSNQPLAYFARANIRYKQLVSLSNSNILEDIGDSHSEDQQLIERRYSHEYEMIMRDYDKVIELIPDFPFVWYNRANLLAEQHDLQSAVSAYSRAVELLPDFGEAYYNRGLTYIFMGQISRGVRDLSKAGELGIYKAYVALKKVQDN